MPMAEIPDEYSEVAPDFTGKGVQVDAEKPNAIPEQDRAYAIAEGWGKWSNRYVGPKGPTPMGITLSIAGVNETSFVMVFSDDEFVAMEKLILTMPYRWREIFDLEFRGYFKGRRYLVSQPQKWRLLGLSRHPYTNRLSAALGAFYVLVKPSIDIWYKQSIRFGSSGISPTET